MARRTKAKTKPGWFSTAGKSKSFWMQLHSLWLMAMTFLADGWDWLLGGIITIMGAVPAVTSDVQQVVSTNDLWAGWLKYEAKSVVVPLVMLSTAVAMIRHVRDKREAGQ